MNFNQLGLEVHDTYKRDERITTNFEPHNNENIINKACFDEKIFKKMVNYQSSKMITTKLNYTTTNNL